MELSAYQHAAGETNRIDGGGTQALGPILGLVSKVGSIVDTYRRHLRDGSGPTINRDLLSEELGDLLWYAAAVATAFDLDLGQIAADNLQRTRGRFLPAGAGLARGIPVFDAAYPEHERFPRRLVVGFMEYGASFGRRAVVLTLLGAEPNAFPSGPVIRNGGKPVGFQVGDRIGDPLTDNSRRVDMYRFHDAIHLGFMAVLGWSPTMRALLRVKRKSDPVVDECEDGARAIFAEEGLATLLSRLAGRHAAFLSEDSVDSKIINVARAAVTDLEVDSLPEWLWRRAIHQGFLALDQLSTNLGGYLTADLDRRTLQYHRTHE